MAEPITVYLAFGLYFLLITNGDYRKQIKPSLIQFIGYCGLCVFCWPWLMRLMSRKRQ